MLRFRFRGVALLAYLLFLIPIAIFLVGWLRWYLAVAGLAILAMGFIWLFRSDYVANRDTIDIKAGHMVAIVACFALFVFLSGSCGVGVESPDIPWRNAILRDLINNDWPLIYEATGHAMVYYLAFWLVPACVGKLLGLGAAYVTLFIVELIVVTVSFLLFSSLIKAQRSSEFWMVAVVLMLFSGLNVVGTIVMQLLNKTQYAFGIWSCEAYCDYFWTQYPTNFYYRGNLDIIEEIYNQMIIWLAVPLMLQNRKVHSYLFLDLILLPFSPWMAIGILPIMIALTCTEVHADIRKEGVGKGLLAGCKSLASPANIAAVVVCGVVFGLFFLSAGSVDGSMQVAGGAEGGAIFGFIDFFHLNPPRSSVFLVYLMFCILEFGVFAFFLFPDHRRDPLFWTTVAWLTIVPLIWAVRAGERNFCLNASVPALMVLMYFLMSYIKEHLMGKTYNIRNLAFSLVLFVAFSSGVLGLCGQAAPLLSNRTLYVKDTDPVVDTVDDPDADAIDNFISLSPDDHLFFRYLSR